MRGSPVRAHSLNGCFRHRNLEKIVFLSTFAQKTTAMQSSGKRHIIKGLALLMFIVFAVFYFYGYNRYFVLCYHEQMQLFRFDSLYFRSCVSQPGGLTKYFGAFLTQFYYCPLAGSLIIASVAGAVVLLFNAILQTWGDTLKLFFVPFIPAILLMMAFVSIYFDMASALGLLLALVGFRIYISLCKGNRYFAGPLLFAILYFTAAGSALLFAMLIIIHELFARNFSFIFLLLWFVLLPRIAWHTIYTVPVREAFFALTPLNDPFITVANIMLWLSAPVLYFLWRLIAHQVMRWNVAVWKISILNMLITFSAMICGAWLIYDVKVETLYGMIFETQYNNPGKVVSLCESYPAKNRLACYFTNLALAQSGTMADSMFHYQQTGISGLFLDRDLTYFPVWYSGEVYYHLGMMLVAEQNALEAMIGSPKEPNTQTMQRLVYTNILRRDSLTADKYLKFFEHSLTYRQWAKKQRDNLKSAMLDSTFRLPHLPKPVRSRDFFIDYQNPDRTLIRLLSDNPHHRIAFEYLMAYYMLLKDLERMRWCLDTFYDNMDYPSGFPVHYEEALLVYKSLMKAGDDFYMQYPVSQATRARYNSYIQAYLSAQGNKSKTGLLQKKFGDTYWYYLHFVEPSTLQKNDEKNRY